MGAASDPPPPPSPPAPPPGPHARHGRLWRDHLPPRLLHGGRPAAQIGVARRQGEGGVRGRIKGGEGGANRPGWYVLQPAPAGPTGPIVHIFSHVRKCVDFKQRASLWGCGLTCMGVATIDFGRVRLAVKCQWMYYAHACMNLLLDHFEFATYAYVRRLIYCGTSLNIYIRIHAHAQYIYWLFSRSIARGLVLLKALG